jgi:hypothetical protein
MLRAARPAERELHDHDGEAEREQEEEIDQNEDRPAVLPADERKAPDVAQPDRTAGGQEDEAEPGTEILRRGSFPACVLSECCYDSA